MTKPARVPAPTRRDAPPATPPTVELDEIVASIGPKIRELRQRRQLSLQQLGLRADVSAAAIHKVERNDMVPTITTLLKLAAALGEPLDHFVDAGTRQPLAVHGVAKTRETVAGDEPGVETADLTSEPNRFQLCGQLVTVAPGARRDLPAQSVPGEEVLYVQDGTLLCEVGKESYALAKSDALQYRTEHPRRWTNTGRRPAKVLVVTLGRR